VTRMAALHCLSATELVHQYCRRALSPVDVVRDTLERIERFKPAINAFASVDHDGAIAAARAAEVRWAQGKPLGLLDGILVTVKDNIWVRKWPARFGSLATDDTPRPEDAPAVARMREHGAIFLGRTTMPEHGWIGVCHSPLTGVTRNPWKLSQTPGGSSGGAAAAALLNLGQPHAATDGAGSIRIPAASSAIGASHCSAERSCTGKGKNNDPY